MKKLLLVLPMLLCGCIENTAFQQEPEKEKTGLELYKECMGYSEKTIIFTNESPERYIVMISEVARNQYFVNKKEQGQIYYTSLLKCTTGNDLSECQGQDSFIIKGIGTKEKWKVGAIKKFVNSDFVFKDNIRTQFLPDGRLFSLVDYCYRDRSNINKLYCPNHISTTDNSLCIDKKPK